MSLSGHESGPDDELEKDDQELRTQLTRGKKPSASPSRDEEEETFSRYLAVRKKKRDSGGGRGPEALIPVNPGLRGER